ncbi:MAG: domain S-box [Verrucomicrobiales bacterium]|nr:domain S-box [Verrucomicrobiales bacterium]
MNSKSFKFRLIFLLLLVLIPTGMLVLGANVQRQESEKKMLREQAIYAAKLAAASQAYYIKQTRQLLSTMTQFPFFVMAKDQGFSRTGMANLKLLQPDFHDFGLIEKDGTVFCHTLGTNLIGDPISLAFARKVLKKPAFSMNELGGENNLKPTSLQFAYPVFQGNKQVIRLMYASLKLPLLSEALAAIPVPEGGVVSVMDRGGHVVAQHPLLQDGVGKKISSFPFAPKVVSQEGEILETDGRDGIRRLYATTSVVDGIEPFLSVQVAVPQKLLFAQADARFGGSLVGFLLISVIVLLIARWYSERAFLRPVGAMLGATELLTKGDLTARTGISSEKSELHILARRFDIMADTLASRQRQLEQANAEIRRNNAELEQRVEERTSELVTLNNELEAFSYSVSHDLRAPLRHMDGFAQLLVVDPSMESNAIAQRYLGLITKSAKQMGALIDDLLSFSKMSRQSMAVEKVDMGQLVSGVVDEIKINEEGREIIWKIGSLPEVRGDVALIRMVWQNLISNAVKYTRARKPAEIEIKGAQKGNELIYSIKDNGAGFNMKYANKLFGVFQRLHRESEFEGTGIGLANVRRIIQRHGGRTWAEAELGKGATFFFSLPEQLS